MARLRQQKSASVPRFADEAAAAAFWDKQSPLDYPDEFQEVQVSFPRRLIKRALTVDLSEEAMGQLTRVASEKGIDPSTLVGMWILDRLRGQATST